MNQVAPTMQLESSVRPEQPLDIDNRRRWGIAVVVALLALIAICLIDFQSVRKAVEVWENSKTYNHGFLILPISLYLLWDRRHFVAGLVPQPLLTATLLIFPLALLWLIGRMISFLEAQQFALVGMMQIALLSIFGWRVFLRLSFPFLYLFFLVPTGDYLVPPLQDFTAAFTVNLLKLVGVPVYSDGIIIEVPAGTFVVAEACAGLRFLIASIAYGVLFAGLIYRSWSRRIAFVVASFVVPVIANGFRAFGLVYAAQLLDSQAAVDADHIIYGWGFFAFITLLLTLGGLRFREAETAPPAAAAGRYVAGPAWKVVVAGILVVMLAGLAPVYADREDAAAEQRGPLALSPVPVEGWRAEAPDTAWKPHFPGATGEVFSSYVGGPGTVQAYIGYYPRQTQSRKVIGSINRIADVDEWRRTAAGTRNIGVGGETIAVAYQHLSAGRANRVVWTWYWINGRFVSGGLRAKLEQLKAEFLGGDRAAAVIVLSSAYGDQPQEAEQVLASFAAGLSTLKPGLRNAGPN